MKAISLWQPWATAIARGLKRVETRAWQTEYRGPLAIHAARRMERAAMDELIRRGVPLPAEANAQTYPLGALVAVAELATICTTRALRNDADGSLWTVRGQDIFGPHERALGDYSDDRYAWILRDVRVLARPVAWRGMRGIFNVPDHLEAKS